MAHFGGPTPKRHFAYSNSRHIAAFNMGALRGWRKQKKDEAERGQEAPTPLVRKYIDKQGKARYHGLPALKSSESWAQFRRSRFAYLHRPRACAVGGNYTFISPNHFLLCTVRV